MRLFSRDNSKELIELKNSINSLAEMISKEFERRDKWEANKERMLFDTLGEKDRLLKKQVDLKDDLALKQKLNEELERENKSQKETIKDLLAEINELVVYKSKNEALEKSVKKLEKEISELKEKGLVVPKKVSGSTNPRKGQAVKETVRTVKGGN